MNPEEFYTYEDRAYVSPTISRDEQLGFVDTLRDVVNQGNEQITTQTKQLGTNVQPSRGGLTGSEGYFQQRYQTTPIEYQANTLKATAQAKALNDLMSNYAAQAKNRYQQAYRKAAKKGSGDPTSNPDDNDPFTPDPIEDGEKYTGLGSITGDSSDSTGDGSIFSPDPEGKYGFWQDRNGNITNTNNPNYAQADDGLYYDISGVSTPLWMEFADLEGDKDFWVRRWKANQKAQEKYSAITQGSGIGGGGGKGGAW